MCGRLAPLALGRAHAGSSPTALAQDQRSNAAALGAQVRPELSGLSAGFIRQLKGDHVPQTDIAHVRGALWEVVAVGLADEGRMLVDHHLSAHRRSSSSTWVSAAVDKKLLQLSARGFVNVPRKVRSRVLGI